MSFFAVPARLGDQLADVGRTGERNLVDVGMVDDGRTGVARAGDDIDHPFRQFRFLKNCARRRAVMLVVSAGFRTTVLPQANAGAIFHAAISSGKFHGMI